MKIPIINSTNKEARYTVIYKSCEEDNWELVESGSLPSHGEYYYMATKDGYYQVTLEADDDTTDETTNEDWFESNIDDTTLTK